VERAFDFATNMRESKSNKFGAQRFEVLFSIWLIPDPPISLGVKGHFTDVQLSRLYGSTDRGRDFSGHALNQSFL
jgi:hypothetical protein